MVTVVTMSDTHLQHYLPHRIQVPKGDLLIHGGDGTFDGSAAQIIEWLEWMDRLPFQHKVFIAGNHDWLFQKDPERAREILKRFPGLLYLEDREATVCGFRIYGSPWTPVFFDWAFQKPRGEKIREKWKAIPDGIDILVTHGPPFGYGDQLRRGDHVGCEELALELRRIRPKLHVFGHIHSGYGQSRAEETVLVNASICDELYDPSHPPIVVELAGRETHDP